MLENGKERVILTKSYEIAYALFRIAGKIDEKDFSEKLRVLGASLLEMAASENYRDTSRSLQVIECLIKFAGDVNIISSANSNILLGEIYTLDAAILEYNNAARNDHINLSDIFSKAEPEFIPPATMYDSSAIEPMQKREVNNPAKKEIKNEKTAIADREDIKKELSQSTAMSSAIRQSAIINKIQQSGNCRMKDIQEMLPDTSERTLRYDLQSLVEKNIIERVGTGGPSVFYRIPQAA